MEWITRVNQALAHIEKKLGEKLDEKEISRITLCPVSTIQRFFVLNTGITLTEYIRRRKISEAAREVLQTESKLLDIAHKYGYESSDTLCVAFKRYFGVTPSEARAEGTVLELYPRIYFKLDIVYDMEELQ